MTDRYFEQITNPNYKKQFQEKLELLYNDSKSLAVHYPDIVHPITGDQPNGPQAYNVAFHAESLIQAGFPDEYFVAELVFWDEIKGNDERWGNSITFTVKSVRYIDLTPVIAIDSHRIHSANTGPRLVSDSKYVDLDGNKLLSTPEFPETLLSASGHDIDLDGADMVADLIRAEVELRKNIS